MPNKSFEQEQEDWIDDLNSTAIRDMYFALFPIILFILCCVVVGAIGIRATL